MRKFFVLIFSTALVFLGACSGDESGVRQGADAGTESGQDIDEGDIDAGPGECVNDDGCMTLAVGLFLSDELLERATLRAQSSEEPFATSYSVQSGRAGSALEREASPFSMDDITEITFGWCSGGENTLSEATSRFEEESDWIRTLALEFALSGDSDYADKALELLDSWAREHTPVNIYDFNPDFSSASIDGQTEGFCSDRPWNFALDAMWQAYGLINVADAYLLLTRNGFQLDADDDELIRGWILEVIEAVNSSFHAWTKWADHHPNSGSYERYRSDNHLTWSLAGLISGAAALEDRALAEYVLSGGVWEDRRAGEYANPSHIRDVLDRAVEGADDGEPGRIYEERILRDPPVGYSLFHLWAMAIVAHVAELHFDHEIWGYENAQGQTLEAVYDRYVEFVLGERQSPEPEQDGDLTDHSWHFEIALHLWDKARYRQAVEQVDRHRFIIQSWGPLALLFGE